MKLTHLILAVVVLGGCSDLSDDGGEGDYGGGSYGSDNYGSSSGSSGSSGTSGSSKAAPSCAKALSVSEAAPRALGDCKLSLVLGSSDSAYRSTDLPSVTYFFPAPPPSGVSVACQPLDGPPIARCYRDAAGVHLRTSDPTELDDLRSRLSWHDGAYDSPLDQDGFSATLDCAGSAAPTAQAFSLVCASDVSADGQDAGSAAPADTDAQAPDTSAVDAGTPTPTVDGGCGG